MGLIELCLLSLLSPQQPTANPGAATATETPALSAPAPDVPEPDKPVPDAPAKEAGEQAETQDPVAHLKALEPAGEYADAAELASLASCDNAKVAARATWLLGKGKTQGHQELLANIATASPHANARLQAMQALKVAGDVASTKTAIEALGDDDIRVRTLAVQLLGKHRRPTALEPLLGMIKRSSDNGGKGPATDVRAALVTLADMGASDHLLRIATSIGDGNAEASGEALAYTFQVLSPQLDKDRETTVLVAVLGHKESMLRRYAITRLTELDSKSAVTALEGRLANEGNELRPLIEVAIAQIRNEGAAPPANELERAKGNAKALWARGKGWWLSLDPLQQGLYGSIPVVLILVFWMLRRAARRRAHEEDGLAAAALVAPSDEYLDREDDYEDGEYDDEEYEDDGEDQDFEEAFEEEGYEDDGQEQFDTSGWDEDEQPVAAADGNPEDELFR